MAAEHRDIIALFPVMLPVLWGAIAVLVPASSESMSSRLARVAQVLVAGTSARSERHSRAQRACGRRRGPINLWWEAEAYSADSYEEEEL